jgi:hypothetical protein
MNRGRALPATWYVALYGHNGNLFLSAMAFGMQNGYKQDKAGIHHIVLAAVLETPPGRNCYGHIEVHEDRIVLKGVDTMMSLDLPLKQLAVKA